MSIEKPKGKKIEEVVKWTTPLVENANTSDILKYIEDFRESKNGKKLNKSFNTLSEKDKMNLYKNGWFFIGNVFKSSRINSLFIYESKKMKAFGPEVSILYRMLVHLWVVDTPSWVEYEELVKNVKKDAKVYNAQINVAQVGCMAFAPEAEPFFAALQPVIKTLSTKAVEIAQKQQEKNNKQNKEVKNIQETTKNDLQENIKDIKNPAA